MPCEGLVVKYTCSTCEQPGFGTGEISAYIATGGKIEVNVNNTLPDGWTSSDSDSRWVDLHFCVSCTRSREKRGG
jgi:hypothetical protein